MTREQVAVLAVVIAMVNGMFSPSLPLFFFANAPAWYPSLLPFHPEFIIYLSRIAAATMTLVLSGIPAALYERFARPDPESSVSSWIWTIAALALSWEALDGFITALTTRG
ncbi:MAG: hypothetical protein WD100_10025 [Tistlia sp.]|uniref:hypothetical protein n=1 Tax=Tistlia sp. TaxID=3057121 RepID=UPI0034A560F8